MRRLTLFLLALTVAVGVAGVGAGAARAGDDNAAVAINTKDGASLFKLAFDIRRVAGDVVDSQNAAVAYSQCERCRTVAIAIQVVLVSSSPSVVTPQNVAIAVNESCNLCETFASAYQFVLGTGGPVRFTQDGRKDLHEIRKDLKELRASDLSAAELDTEVDAIVDRLRGVLETQLVPVGSGQDAVAERVEEETEEPLPTVDTPTGSTATETAPPPETLATTETAPPPETLATTETTTEPPPTETAPPSSETVP